MYSDFLEFRTCLVLLLGLVTAPTTFSQTQGKCVDRTSVNECFEVVGQGIRDGRLQDAESASRALRARESELEPAQRTSLALLSARLARWSWRFDEAIALYQPMTSEETSKSARAEALTGLGLIALERKRLDESAQWLALAQNVFPEFDELKLARQWLASATRHSVKYSSQSSRLRDATTISTHSLSAQWLIDHQLNIHGEYRLRESATAVTLSGDTMRFRGGQWLIGGRYWLSPQSSLHGEIQQSVQVAQGENFSRRAQFGGSRSGNLRVGRWVGAGDFEFLSEGSRQAWGSRLSYSATFDGVNHDQGKVVFDGQARTLRWNDGEYRHIATLGIDYLTTSKLAVGFKLMWEHAKGADNLTQDNRGVTGYSDIPLAKNWSVRIEAGGFSRQSERALNVSSRLAW